MGARQSVGEVVCVCVCVNVRHLNGGSSGVRFLEICFVSYEAGQHLGIALGLVCGAVCISVYAHSLGLVCMYIYIIYHVYMCMCMLVPLAYTLVCACA